MNVTPKQMMNDLINQPGLGMFAWMCVVFFGMAFVFFLWAFKSGQMSNIEDIKFDMLEDNPKKEVHNNG